MVWCPVIGGLRSSGGGDGGAAPKKECIGNTALCKVKRATHHDFQFVLEVITPSQRIYVLQAQTAREYEEWFYVLSNQCARLLLRKNTIDRFVRAKQPGGFAVAEQERAERERMAELRGRIVGRNGFCADCSRANPEWVSVNIGVVVCTECCGVHRGLGTHISKMRSLTLDKVWGGGIGAVWWNTSGLVQCNAMQCNATRLGPANHIAVH